METKLAPPGFAAEDILIGRMVYIETSGRYATMRDATKETPVGVAPKDITKGQLFRPISHIDLPGVVIDLPGVVLVGENEETD